MRLIEKNGNYPPPVYHQTKKITLDPAILERNRLVCASEESDDIEYYKIIKAQILQQMVMNNWQTVMVTSVMPEEGKTLIAINLAMTFAKSYNQTVLLVDADLKQQSVHKYLDYESDNGLIDYLVHDRPIHDLLVWPGIEKLTIMSGGDAISDSMELLGSPKMKMLVDEMKDRYKDRYIIFDVPPIIGRSDALAFSGMVDAILIVVQAYQTPKASIQKSLELIPKEKFLGFILNRQRVN